MLELGDKGIKMIIITVSHMFRKLVEPWKIKKKSKFNFYRSKLTVYYTSRENI